MTISLMIITSYDDNDEADDNKNNDKKPVIY